MKATEHAKELTRKKQGRKKRERKLEPDQMRQKTPRPEKKRQLQEGRGKKEISKNFQEIF